MNVQAAGDADRFSHDQPTNVLSLEPALFDLVGPQLAAIGHQVRSARGGDLAAGGYQAIHRKDGAAVGW